LSKKEEDFEKKEDIAGVAFDGYRPCTKTLRWMNQLQLQI
jgi:hypothetical protein